MAKRKTLPKDFEDQLKRGDVEALKAALGNCLLEATGGYRKQTALAFNECPDELARWLVNSGADITAPDSYGETPLHSRAGHWKGNLGVLLDLGADPNSGDGSVGTPLHNAVGVGHAGNVRLLIERGARVDAINARGQTPLEYALQRCSNAGLERMADAARAMLDADAKITSAMREHVTKLGETFEFHRAGYNKETVGEASAALDLLYAMFGVEPVPRRAMHDGKSTIVAKSSSWDDQHQELWELLVPSSGAADTVQGEVVRLSGKIHHELHGNGGMNWDPDFKAMADAFMSHVASGKPLPKAELDEVAEIIKAVKRKDSDVTHRMCELAVRWVALNPKPVKLEQPDYRR